MIKNVKLLGLLVLLTGLSACYKTSDVTYLDELDVTYTSFDQEQDFRNLVKLVVRDSIVLVQNHWDDSDVEDFYKPGGASENGIAAIKEKFESIGYEIVSDIEEADIAMNVTLMSLKYTETAWYPPLYPGWGWGGWPYYGYGGYSSSYWWGYPGWGWGYPYYGYSYSYKTGTLNLEMATASSLAALKNVLDRETPESVKSLDETEIPMVDLIWSALVDGYQGSTKQYNIDRLERGLDEAIVQSDTQIDGFVKQ